MKDMTTQRMLLTTAVFAALALLMVAPANAYFAAVDGGGGSAAVAPSIEPGTIPYLSHGVGVDESLFSGQTDRLDTAIQTAMDARGAEQAAQAQRAVEPNTIPYLSHGIGVDESQFSGQQQSLGLTGDSPLTRDMPVTSTVQATSTGNDFDWTWAGLGAGLAALVAASMAGIFLSARHRGRVALP